MTHIIQNSDLSEHWSENASSSSERMTISPWAHHNRLRPLGDKDRVQLSYARHRQMILDSSSGNENIRPLYMVRTPQITGSLSVNSSANLISTARKYYSAIEQQLNELAQDEDEGIEKGAVDTALVVLNRLISKNLAPPALSWHGGDAVVMIWALGDTTYAITITDGEIGYVVRRKREAVDMGDSISLNKFILSDLR